MGFGNYIEVGKMDELGRLDSPVHRLDPRAKILATIVFLVTVMSFGRYEISALMVFFAYPVVLLSSANLPVGYFLKKIAIATPFALFVGMFNPLLDRDPMAVIAGYPIASGWFSFASILFRFVLTVSAGLILIASTGINRLCNGLEQLGVPRLFVMQLLFLYRYFFVIADEAVRMRRAVEMRSAGNHRLGLATYGSLVGHLLLRSMDRAQRIYLAMVSRGFGGEGKPGFVSLDPSRSPAHLWQNAFYFLGWCFFFVAARYWNFAAEFGRRL